MLFHGNSNGGARSAFLACAGLAAVLLIAACDVVETDTAGAGRDAAMLGPAVPMGEAAAAPGSPNAAFFPLAIGNSWEYAGEFAIWMEGGTPQTTFTREVHTLAGYETLFDREYVLEERSITYNDMPPAAMRWYRYRQDKAGLYEADVSVTDPPGDDAPQAAEGLLTTGTVSPWPRLFADLAAGTPEVDKAAFESARDEMQRKLALVEYLRGGSERALLGGGPPGGVLPEELTRLRYPLHVGREWIVREEPQFTSIVERHEVLDLPAGKFGGWRIRVINPMLGPNDTVLLWYGRDGLLATYAWLEVEMVGPTGDPLGMMISEESLLLEDIEIH